ncbi:MAG: redox-sensing transcriptional repressor Rex, partial [FCB group bacterium]|nr:redox-sensing transcriptional repressor Rex [FCB group bacterium]
GGRDIVSSREIAAKLGLDPIQVRKDLQFTGVIGKPKVGYVIDNLISLIESFLGWDNTSSAYLAGAGNLGTAILGYEGFRGYGVDIVAVFDNDSRKIGTEINSYEVYDIEKITGLAERMNVNIGIITVPAADAQDVADRMVRGGIKAIWNFAPVKLNIPDNVIVENEQLSTSLAVLTSKLKQKTV